METDESSGVNTSPKRP